ncbi:MAG TPA: T9SS type A sorting domain-containing protein [Saprospiraceae bacterium]|nr:T9SS type A sorting domain-containing protein [Saprospiraceae bacterium]
MQRKSTPCSHPFHVLFRKLTLLVLAGIFLPQEGSCTVFHIECPPDVTVNCDAELWDLSIYGNAIVYGYGAPESAGPPISVDYNLNNCNTGTIVRTWVAYDYGGNPYYCSQTITVSGGGGSDIQWPPDYILHSCNPQTDPDDLPPPYDHPVLNYGDCSQLLTNYEDLIFNINPPACKKILRKWTVIDWCLFDPNSYDPIGIWTHTQIIKITPANPPIIWCPGDTTVSAGADCTGGHVSLPDAYGSSDCGAGVIITNNSPYAYNHGANASGNYPLGTTKVTFWADDGCGQKISCSMYISVKDLKKPTPICYYGITVTLMQMPDGYYMLLRPSFFDKGSFDNCTPKNKLKMWVEPSRVDCEDLGDTPVRLYVEDESGNIEYCNTLVYVQDNLGICPPEDGIIEGVIVNAAGEALHEVNVSLQGTADFSMTNTDGFYAFPAVPFGHAYTVFPTLPGDDMNGVTTIDMAILLRHILGVERLTTPYQFIAADMDKSGRVSVSDLLAMKDLILKDYYALHPTTTWRFADASYTFQNALDPLSETFPESYQIPMFTQNMNALDFIGIKLGDLNHDAQVNISGEYNILSRGAGVTLGATDRNFSEGEAFEVLLAVDAFKDIEAMQLAVELNRNVLEVIDIKSLHKSPGLDIINRIEDYGVISVLWYGVEPLVSPQIFSITLHALKNGRLSEELKLKEALSSIAYRTNVQQPYPVQLQFTKGEITDDPSGEDVQKPMRVLQNYPNPFSTVTGILVDLIKATELEIEVFDLSGREILRKYQSGVQGLQEIRLSTSDIGVHGMVLCRITAGTATETLRMVINPG